MRGLGQPMGPRGELRSQGDLAPPALGPPAPSQLPPSGPALQRGTTQWHRRGRGTSQGQWAPWPWELETGGGRGGQSD